MGQAMRRLGQTLRAAESTGATSYEVGVTVGAPVDRWVQVDIAGRVWPVHVPGSFRATLADGQSVRVSVSVDGVRTLDSILSALPAPAVATTPTASTIAPAVNSTVSSGAYDYDITANDWAAVKAYTKDIASSTRGLAADINELRGDLATVAADLASLKATVNGMRSTLEAIRQALASQGHIT